MKTTGMLIYKDIQSNPLRTLNPDTAALGWINKSDENQINKSNTKSTLVLQVSRLPRNRDCHGLPWGFSRQPMPMPVETHACSYGHRFLWGQVISFICR
jgi:glycerol-3-phosphate cytidylyltransferase-like family protein